MEQVYASEKKIHCFFKTMRETSLMHCKRFITVSLKRVKYFKIDSRYKNEAEFNEMTKIPKSLNLGSAILKIDTRMVITFFLICVHVLRNVFNFYFRLHEKAKRTPSYLNITKLIQISCEWAQQSLVTASQQLYTTIFK